MWTDTRLKYLAALPISNGLGESGQYDESSWPRYIRTTDIAGPRTLRSDTFASLPPEIAIAARVRKGDILMTAAGTVGKTVLIESDQPACFAGYLVRFRPRQDVYARFISYWTETPLFLGQVEAGKVRSTIDNFSASKYANLRLTVPPLDVQRRIADFLDSETARIDALVEKRRGMVGLVGERWKARLAGVFDPDAQLRLKYLLGAPLAYGVLVPEHDEAGVPMLRIVDLRQDTVDLETVARISPRLSDEYRRTVVRVRDLVVSVVGTLGRSIEIDAELAGCNLNRPLARVQLQPDVPRTLIRLWFASDLFGDQARLATASDSAQATLGLEDLGNFRVGLSPDRSNWGEVAATLAEHEARFLQTAAALRSQIDLLAEHRQAVITAAVTGELDVAEAA